MDTTTRHERRLLRAAAAAQVEHEAILDNFLFKIAPNPAARLPLVRAVALLASGLVTSGHWLSCGSIPAPALPVARLRGLDLGIREIGWPDPGPSPAPEDRR